MSPRVISAVAANPVLMPNFNVPFQASNQEEREGIHPSIHSIAASFSSPPHSRPLTGSFSCLAQSGDDEVLRLMRRGYNRERYLSIVRQIRLAMPDAVSRLSLW